jgi:hypothetical protein
MEQIKLFNTEAEKPAARRPATTPDIFDKIAAARAKVFIYPESDSDERYIRQAIADYLAGKTKHSTLTRAVTQAIWDRNDKGHRSKYMYFNNHSQYLHIDNDTMAWVKLVAAQMTEDLLKLQHFAGEEKDQQQQKK